MKELKKVYATHFYDNQHADSFASAEVIVELIRKWVNPQSVADVGCGIGTWLSVWKKLGVSDLLGIDGGWIFKNKLYLEEKYFKEADLSQPLFLGRQFDLAVSVEVAEHLYEDVSETFVESLTNLAPVVVFSAAIPRQGGDHHVNEQWPEYWAEKFNQRGYVAVDIIRPLIWNHPKVLWWYKQNLIIFVQKEKLSCFPDFLVASNRTDSHDLTRIHPTHYLLKARPLKERLKEVLLVKFKRLLKLK